MSDNSYDIEPGYHDTPVENLNVAIYSDGCGSELVTFADENGDLTGGFSIDADGNAVVVSLDNALVSDLLILDPRDILDRDDGGCPCDLDDTTQTADELIALDSTGHPIVFGLVDATTGGRPEHDFFPTIDTSQTPANSRAAVDIKVDLPNQTIFIGPATLDTDQDSVPDTALLHDDTGTVIVLDANHDGVAEKVAVYEGSDLTYTPTVELHRSSSGEWTAHHVPSSSESVAPTSTAAGADFLIPSQFLPAIDPNAPLPVQVAMHADLAFAEMAGALWNAAYPGQPWPVDETNGLPYSPAIIVGVIANDPALAHDHPEIVRQASAAEASWSRITQDALQT